MRPMIIRSHRILSRLTTIWSGIYLLAGLCLIFLAGCYPGDWRTLHDAQSQVPFELTEEQSDLIFRACKDLPEQTQLAIALIKDSTTTFYGVEIRNDSLLTINNQCRVFEIGSLTKLFTAYLLSEAINKHGLDVHQTISSLLPDSREQMPKITLLQLANHTSGVPRMPSNWSIWEADLKNPYAHFDREYLLEYLEGDFLTKTAPGERFSYSNVGMVMLGLALETWTGHSYDTLIEEWISRPLGLQHTGLDRSALNLQLVPGLNRRGQEIPYWDLNAMAPAGGLLSTIADLEQLIRSFMIRDDDDVHLTLRPTFSWYQDGRRQSVGMGWMIRYDGGDTIYWHNGGTAGFSSTVRMNIPSQAGIIILSNVSAIYGNKRVNIEHVADQLMITLMRDSEQ